MGGMIGLAFLGLISGSYLSGSSMLGVLWHHPFFLALLPSSDRRESFLHEQGTRGAARAKQRMIDGVVATQ